MRAVSLVWALDMAVRLAAYQAINPYTCPPARADHVKFNFPAAWTVAVLAWEVIEFGGGFTASGQLPYALDNLRWGADYLIRCRISENVTIAQVTAVVLEYCW